ncbi:MAG: PAS domain S-box protein [Nitrospirota bacterium]
MEFLDIFKLSNTLENVIDSLSLIAILAPFFYLYYKAGKTLSASETKYRPLFENMLDGFAYCELLYDIEGNPADFIYLDVNRAFEELTGLKNVVGKKVTEVVPGIKESNPELFEVYGRVASTGLPEKFEIEIKPLKIWFSISAYSPANGYFVALFDNITERKRMEEEREITIEFLRLVNESASTDGLIQAAATFFQVKSGCEAVGVRLHEGDDYPYYEARGFPKEFVKMENSLCVHDKSGDIVRNDTGNPILACMCGNIICGRFDASKPFFTAGGSFWSNCTTELLATTNEADRNARTRNRCNGEGYESVALVPMRVGADRIGLIQLNDRREGMFTPEIIAQWERLARYMSVALAKSRAEDAQRESERQFREMLANLKLVAMILDTEGNILFCNDFILKLTGWRRGEVQGRNWFDIFIPEDAYEDLKELFVASIGKGTIPSYHENTIKTSSGDLRLIAWNNTVIRDSNGLIAGTASIGEDITDQRAAERTIDERNVWLAMLNKIDKAMVSTFDLKEIFGILVENLTKALNMESGIVFLYDDFNKAVSAVENFNFEFADGNACFPVESLPLISEVIKNNKQIILDDVGEETVAYKMTGAKSIMLVPLSVKGIVHGIICLHNKKSRHIFSDPEMEFARQVSDQAMIAIVNAKLVKSLTDNDTKLVSRNRQLLALNEVASIIASNQDISVMLRMVLEMTLFLPFLEVTKGSIFLRDEKHPAKFNMAAHVGLTPCTQITSGQCLCGVAAESGEIVLSSDCSDDPRHTLSYPDMKRHGHVIIPIKSKDGVLGVMSYYLESGTFLAEAEIHLLTSISNQLATGILNHRFLEKIAAGKNEWESTFDAMEEIVTIHGTDFTILRANRAASNYLGKGPDQIVGRKCYEVFHGTKEPIPLCPARELLESLNNSVRQEIFSDGRYFEISVYPVFADEKVGSFVHIAKDITELKRVNNALKESEEKFRNLVEQSLVGVYIVQDGLFRYANPRFSAIMGYTADELIDVRGPKDIVYAEDLPLVKENVRRREAQEVESQNYSFRVVTKDGEIVHVNVYTVNTIYDGRLAGIGVLIDITETILARDELVKKTQEAVILRHARIQSEEVNRLKSEFLANMSHELRTPLNAVIGLSQVLIDKTYGPLVEKQEEYLRGINQSGQHLIGLINEILDLSKIEAGKEQIELANFSLKNLLNNSFIMIKEKALKNNIELVREIDSGIGMLHADERRIKQIIYNLLSNAVKFTNPGGKVGLKASSGDDELTITVWDTGIGIPENKKHLIFQPFQLIDSSLTRRHEGTGLGLVLTRKLVELHHGRITFESMEGKGTSFTIVLPLSDEINERTENDHTTVPESICPDNMISGTKIMIVEDNSLNMLLAADYLKARGAVAFEALDGITALEKADAETPDLILMDIQMPEMDGFEVLKRLKMNPRTVGIPAIAMTALATKADQEKCLRYGFDDYISKPVNLSEMIDKIHSILMKGAANE